MNWTRKHLLDIESLSADEIRIILETTRAFKAVEQAFGVKRTHWLVENVAGMNTEDLLLFSQQRGAKPYRIEAMDLGLVRRPRLYWLSWALRPRTGVIDITEEEKYYKVKLHVASAEFPAWTEGGWVWESS